MEGSEGRGLRGGWIGKVRVERWRDRRSEGLKVEGSEGSEGGGLRGGGIVGIGGARVERWRDRRGEG